MDGRTAWFVGGGEQGTLGNFKKITVSEDSVFGHILRTFYRNIIIRQMLNENRLTAAFIFQVCEFFQFYGIFYTLV